MADKNPQKRVAAGKPNDVGLTSMAETPSTRVRISKDLRTLMAEVRPGRSVAGFVREATVFYIGYLLSREGKPAEDVENIMRRVGEDIIG